jgi:enterochelin esterase family protein
MVIAMPDGMMPRGAADGGSDPLFERDLLNDIKPLVESEYRISAAREDRAIAGLSMGGGQAMWVGLQHPGLFAYVGIFSSGNMASGGVDRFAGILADPEKANRQFRVLYLSCGLEDSRIEGTRKVDAALTAKGVHHIFKAEPGGHAFNGWRRDLTEFAALLF